MKKMISQCFVNMLLLFSIGLPGVVVAEAEKSFQNEKCYITPESLSIDKQGLYVHFNDMIYSVSGVSVDNQGVYVLANELVDSKVIARCPVGHPNPPWQLVCQVCGRSLY